MPPRTTNEGPSCPFCNRRFKRNAGIKRHIRQTPKCWARRIAQVNPRAVAPRQAADYLRFRFVVPPLRRRASNNAAAAPPAATQNSVVLPVNTGQDDFEISAESGTAVPDFLAELDDEMFGGPPDDAEDIPTTSRNAPDRVKPTTAIRDNYQNYAKKAAQKNVWGFSRDEVRHSV